MPLLWPLLTSAAEQHMSLSHSMGLVPIITDIAGWRTGRRPPQLRAITFIPCSHWIYLSTLRLDFVTFGRLILSIGLVSNFCSLARDFAIGLPSHNHSHACTCRRLVVLPLGSTAPTVDFHHLVIAHAGQTKNNSQQNHFAGCCYHYSTLHSESLPPGPIQVIHIDLLDGNAQSLRHALAIVRIGQIAVTDMPLLD